MPEKSAPKLRAPSGNYTRGLDFLQAAQLQQFYEWLDSGKRWSVKPTDQVEGVPPKTALYFPFHQPDDKTMAQDAENGARFAREVYADLTGGVPNK